MNQLTRAQKARLGAFLIVAALILAGTLIALFGLAALEDRDVYIVRFDGSVTGLSPGSTVKYNGIDVGRVEEVEIDPERVSGVRVTVSLKKGTPVRVDTRAVLAMQGITGLKVIELKGGSDDSEDRKVGTEIPSVRSELDDLAARAGIIAREAETLLTNLVAATSGENAELLTGILKDVRSLSSTTVTLIDDNKSAVATLLANLDGATSDLRTAIQDVRTTLTAAQGTLKTAESWVDKKELTRLLKTGTSTLERLSKATITAESALRTAEKRLSKEELGETLSSFTGLAKSSTGLVKRADVTLVSARDDLLRALSTLSEGAEALSELAQLLRDDPSSLIFGRTGKERKAP